ncbi:uncharacterized protein TNCV_4958771 [Trichonephila clavipes]|uniref:Uncharacterized protein n=1 Tax=Trichonephila clavipes TaxID=2585209 RepID=A0A8X6VCP3_TRICX|nr:uncharacterized protein TNCV_4958771 [Trichonephila clavipes]
MIVQLPPGSTLVYCYRCTNVDFAISSTSAAPWISYESRFNLGDPDAHVPVRRYAGERCLPKCVIERHSGLTPKLTVWGCDFVSYGRSNVLRIENNLNSNRYVYEVLQL